MKANTHRQRFLTGPRKCLIYCVIIVHVVLYCAREVLRGRIRWWRYPVVLRRAWLFLIVLRHHKLVKRGWVYKLHLYVPAYPTRAFLHKREKFFVAAPGPAPDIVLEARLTGLQKGARFGGA